MEINIKYAMAQGIARAIIERAGEFSVALVDGAKSFVGAAEYWTVGRMNDWEKDSMGWKRIVAHKEEWEGKL